MPDEEPTEEPEEEPKLPEPKEELALVQHAHKGTDTPRVSHKDLLDNPDILTPAQKTDLTDGGASTAHKHDHGGQDGLDDNDHGAIYYTETEVDNLIAAVNAKTGAGAYNAAVFTPINRVGVNSENTNTDQAITLGFQPRFIKLYYYISGRSAAAASRMGMSIFSGTSLLANVPTFGELNGRAGVPNRATTAGDYPDYPDALVNEDFVLSVDDTETIIAGLVSAGTTGLQIILTIPSVTATGFTLRANIQGGSGCSAQYVIFHGWYEAYL